MKTFTFIFFLIIKSTFINASLNSEEYTLGGFFAKKVANLEEALSHIDEKKVPLNEETLILVDEDLFQEERLSTLKIFSGFKIFSEKNCKFMIVKSFEDEEFSFSSALSLFDPLNTEAFLFEGYYGAKIQNGYLCLPKAMPDNYLDFVEDHQWLFFGKILKKMLTCFKNKNVNLKTLLYLSKTAEMFRSLYLESFPLKVVPIFVENYCFDILASRDPILYYEPFKDRFLVPEHTFNKWEILVEKFIQDPVKFCNSIHANLEGKHFSLEDTFYVENEGFRKYWLKTLQKYYQTTEELVPIHSAIKYGYFKDARDVFGFVRKFKRQTQAEIFHDIPPEIQNVTKFLNEKKNYLSLLILVASIEDRNNKIFFLKQFGQLLMVLYQNMKPEKKEISWPLPHRLDVIRFVSTSEMTDKEKKKQVINSAFKIIMEAFYYLDKDVWKKTVSFFKKESQYEGESIFNRFPSPVKNPEGILKTVITYLHLIPFYPQILKGNFIVDTELDFTIQEMIKNSLKMDPISDYPIILRTFLSHPLYIKKFFLTTKCEYNILKKLNTHEGIHFFKKVSNEKFNHIILYLNKNKYGGFTEIFGWETEGSNWQFKIVKSQGEITSKYLSFLSNFDLSTDEKQIALIDVEKKFKDTLSRQFDYGCWKELSQIGYKAYIRMFVEACSSPEIRTYKLAQDFWQMCPYTDPTGYPKLVECLQNQDEENIEKITDTLKFYINQIPYPYTIFTNQGGTDRYIKLIKAMLSLSPKNISYFYEEMEKESKKKLDYILLKNTSSYDKALVFYFSGDIIYSNFEKDVFEILFIQSNEKKRFKTPLQNL